MKASELMLDDWVIRKGIPSEPMQIAGFDKFRNLVYMDFQGRGITENLDGIEPIPLTHEILEKNGFKEHGPFYGDKEYISDFHVMLRSWTNGETFNFHFYTPETRMDCLFPYPVKYVHELQHIIKVCKVDKKIII